jgi:hypothetical protein
MGVGVRSDDRWAMTKLDWDRFHVEVVVLSDYQMAAS